MRILPGPARRRVRTRVSWKAFAGGSSLVAMLLLASPGVRIARAEPPAPEPVPYGGLSGAGSCRVGDSAPRLPSARALGPALARIEQRAAEEDIVVFDGTGLNYHSDQDPGSEIRRIQEELQRERLRRSSDAR